MALFCGVLPAFASADPRANARIVMLPPSAGDPLLDEALVRMGGELQAVGLIVDIRTGAQENPQGLLAESDAYAAISFERGPNGAIYVRVYSLGGESVAQVVVDPRRPEVTAEVVAVRAVELLRATLQQYVTRLERKEVPPALRRFTGPIGEHAAPIPSSPNRQQAEERRRATAAESARVESEARAPSAGSAELRLGALLGPTFVVQTGEQLTGAGAQCSIFLGQGWYALGAAFELALRPTEVEDRAGKAAVSNTAGALLLRAKYDVASASELFAQLGAGLSLFSIDAEANAGYISQNERHGTPLFLVEAGGVHWLHDNVGLYLSLRTSYVSNAPELRFAGREIATLWQPAFWVSTGVALAVPSFATEAYGPGD